MYKYIKNQNNKRYVNVHSNLGRAIIRNFLELNQIGGLLKKKKNQKTIGNGKQKIPMDTQKLRS